MATLLIVVFFLSLVLGLPIAFCLGLTSVVAVYMMDVPLRLIAQRMFTGMDSFPLMAVPFFVLAGDLMNVGGPTRGLINFANVLVGRIRGGLAHTNIVASMFLAGISGSAVADASAIASIMVPGMVKAGYGRDSCTGSLTGSTGSRTPSMRLRSGF
jgi:C4-dicarboxylate transporter DctM subunit